jgi:hypothetical protein
MKNITNIMMLVTGAFIVGIVGGIVGLAFYTLQKKDL